MISFKKVGMSVAASALCVAMGLGFAGCGSENNTASGGDTPVNADVGGTAAKGDSTTLIYAAPTYTTVNPVINGRGEKAELPDIIFSGLMTHNGKGEPIPDMAQDYSYDPASLTYTFKIKDGIKFHDGQPCTAEDVKFTLDILTQNKDLSATIKDNYTEIESVTVIDPLTVQIKLSKVNVAMLDYLCVGILPKHLLEGKDIMTDSFNQNPVGTGRYKFVSWDAGQSITVEKNTGFYGKVPSIEKIIFKIVPDENARALQVKSGEVDLAWLNAQNTAGFRGNTGYHVYDFTSADYRAIAPNFNAPFWKENRKLVSVLSYAVNRQSIVNSVLTGQGETAYSPIQLNATYNDETVNHYDYNPDKFKEEIEKLGWTMGTDGIYEKDGKKCAFRIDVSETEEERVDIANVVSQQFKKLGVDMKVNLVSSLDWGTMEAFLIGQAAPFDVDEGTYTLFGTGKSNNYTNYSNAEVDKYLQLGRETEDLAKRKEAYKNFQQALSEDPAYIYVAYLLGNYVSVAGLNGPSTERVLGHHAVGVMWNVEDWTLNR